MDGWSKWEVFPLSDYFFILLLSQNLPFDLIIQIHVLSTSSKGDERTEEVIRINQTSTESQKNLCLSYNAPLMIVMVCLCCITSCNALVAFPTILSSSFASRLSPTVCVTHFYFFLIIIFFTYWLRKTSVQQSPC